MNDKYSIYVLDYNTANIYELKLPDEVDTDFIYSHGCEDYYEELLEQNGFCIDNINYMIATQGKTILDGILIKK